MTFVLAGNHREYTDYKRAFVHEEMKYIGSHAPEKLAGYSCSKLVVIGTFWDRPDADKIYDSVARCLKRGRQK